MRSRSFVFLEYFGDCDVRVPAAGFEVMVFTRFDTADGRRPPFRSRICAQAGNHGEPLRLYMYNTSGEGVVGYHYDPMVGATPRNVAGDAGAAQASGPIVVDVDGEAGCEDPAISVWLPWQMLQVFIYQNGDRVLSPLVP